MHPAVRACLATAALAALTGASPGRPLVRVLRPPPQTAPSSSAAAPTGPIAVPCPSGSLPDGDGCVPFGQATEGEGVGLESQTNQHRDRQGQLKVYEQIPRRPDRPEAYEAYRYPIPTAEGQKLALSGFDLDLPEEQQRRGPHLKAVGHGGVDLAAPRGTEVRALPLEHQEGDAEVLYTGQLFGLSVVTRHTRKENGRLQDYVAILGHLDSVAPGLPRGARVPAGALLGAVGDSGSEGIVHLHLELRRVRDSVDVALLAPGKLVANDRTIAVDPRNLLPLR
jgi:murein DD-endopeptidase MepM/ murein hydrolase activator NlpD